MKSIDVVDSSPRRGRWRTLLLLGSLFPVVVVSSAFALQGRPLAEKTATELVTPITLIWWGSLVLGLFFWYRAERRLASILLLIAVVLYATCAPMITGNALSALERRIPSTEVTATEPFDVVILLGGGASVAPDGRAQLAASGDRIGWTLQLYHQRLVKRIVVTGSSLALNDGSDSTTPARLSKSILIGAGVAPSDLDESPGINTAQEMAALSQRPELWRGKRCGLVTSAFHMPRAMKLAEKNQVTVLPLPTDYRIVRWDYNFLDLFPSARGAAMGDLALREYLGIWMGR